MAVGLRDLGSRYGRLKNDVDSAIALHQSLIKQRLETAVNSALAASNVRVIERAEVPQRPTHPNVPLNLLLGLLAGGACALGATFVCEYFDNSVKSSEEVEGLLQLPTLATVPNFALARRSRGPRPLPAPEGTAATDLAAASAVARELVVLHEPWSPTAEAFRSLRTAVLFSTPGAPPKVILVTSAGAGEGKTVSSLEPRDGARRVGLARPADRRRPATTGLPPRARRRQDAGSLELPRRPGRARRGDPDARRAANLSSSPPARRRRIRRSWSARRACAMRSSCCASATIS